MSRQHKALLNRRRQKTILKHVLYFKACFSDSLKCIHISQNSQNTSPPPPPPNPSPCRQQHCSSRSSLLCCCIRGLAAIAKHFPLPTENRLTLRHAEPSSHLKSWKWKTKRSNLQFSERQDTFFSSSTMQELETAPDSTFQKQQQTRRDYFLNRESS